MTAPRVEHHHLGRVDYADALAEMQRRWQGVHEGTLPEAIYTLEHNAVVTSGRRGDLADLRVPLDELSARGVAFSEADRGGELTFHGPGQLVVYPVLDIRARKIHVGDLVRGLAASAAARLEPLGVAASYDADAPGLWCNGRKIGSVGMRIRRGISQHGMSLNLTTDLSAFDLFVACGMPDRLPTSVLIEAGVSLDVARFGAEVVGEVARRFSLRLEDAA